MTNDLKRAALTTAAWHDAAANARTGTFVPAEVLRRLDDLTPVEADRADCGVVRLSDTGVVELYNAYESNLAGMAAADVIGKNFFTQVAPCTNNRLFKGAFAKGVEEGAMDLVFAYTFTYRMAPTAVDIHLLRKNGRNWMFVKKR